MTLETHNIEVRARDNASQVLRQIGQSATQAFDSMDRSASRFNVNRAELSAGLRQVQGMMSDFARAAAEEEAIFGTGSRSRKARRQLKRCHYCNSERLARQSPIATHKRVKSIATEMHSTI
jgi:ABC-type transporter Mla subunit MlaD